MQKLKMAIVSSVVLLSSIPSMSVQAANQTSNVVMMYKNEAGKKEIEKATLQVHETLSNVQMIEGEVPTQKIEQLKESENIEFVQKESRKKLQTLNTASVGVLYSWNLMNVNKDKLIDDGLTGKGVKIGIIDTGVYVKAPIKNVHHVALLAEDPDTPEIDTGVDDQLSTGGNKGHATFIAGILAAQNISIVSSNTTYEGLVPESDIYSIKIVASNGATSEDFAKAIDYAIKQKIDILNISLGVPEGSEDEVLEQAIKKAHEAGILLVAAAGNKGVNAVEYPANYSGVIAVSSVDENNVIASTSNTGAKIEFAAPGKNVVSLNMNNAFVKGSGTSYATPHVVGLLAALKEKYPEASNKTIQTYLQQMVLDKGTLGRDTTYGYGVAQYNPNLLKTETASEIEQPKQELITKTPKTEVVVAPVAKLTTTPKLTEGQKYVKNNAKTIKTWMTTIQKGGKITYLTKFAPLYSVKGSLTKSQQKAVDLYAQKIKLYKVTATSNYAKATNLTTFKKKKYTTIKYASALKLSTVKTSNIAVYKDGKKQSGFKVVKPNKKSANYFQVKTTKTLAKGTYKLYVSNSGMKSAKNNKVSRPLVISFTVK